MDRGELMADTHPFITIPGMNATSVIRWLEQTLPFCREPWSVTVEDMDRGAIALREIVGRQFWRTPRTVRMKIVRSPSERAVDVFLEATDPSEFDKIHILLGFLRLEMWFRTEFACVQCGAQPNQDGETVVMGGLAFCSIGEPVWVQESVLVVEPICMRRVQEMGATVPASTGDAKGQQQF